MTGLSHRRERCLNPRFSASVFIRPPPVKKKIPFLFIHRDKCISNIPQIDSQIDSTGFFFHEPRPPVKVSSHKSCRVLFSFSLFFSFVLHYLIFEFSYNFDTGKVTSTFFILNSFFLLLLLLLLCPIL